MVRSLVSVGSIIRLVYHQPGVTLKCPAFEQHKGNSDETMCRCERGFIIFLCRCAHLHTCYVGHVVHRLNSLLLFYLWYLKSLYFICAFSYSHMLFIIMYNALPFSISIYLWCFLNVCFPKFVVITCGQPIWENIKKKRNEEKGHTRQIILWLTICYCYKTDEKLEKWSIKCTFIFVWP